ncbi:hypothetical protein Btru_033583 [Bulinus truncatus]|nr:hypothetical protein Btru_033583 [Bulinus truncatus]
MLQVMSVVYSPLPSPSHTIFKYPILPVWHRVIDDIGSFTTCYTVCQQNNIVTCYTIKKTGETGLTSFNAQGYKERDADNEMNSLIDRSARENQDVRHGPTLAASFTVDRSNCTPGRLYSSLQRMFEIIIGDASVYRSPILGVMSNKFFNDERQEKKKCHTYTICRISSHSWNKCN